MIKGAKIGKWSCVAKNGKPKKKFGTPELVIKAAKKHNATSKNPYKKLVGYKCAYCHKYHLTMKSKKR